MQITKIFLVLGSFNAMLAVILGAFGAHGLKARIPSDMLAVYQTVCNIICITRWD